MYEELISSFLPEGVLEWSDVEKIEKDEQKIRIIFKEKNLVPEIPKEHRSKTIESKGKAPNQY